VSEKKRSDARIAVAMPPRIGTNIMMVMREDTHHGTCKIAGVPVSASFFYSSSQQQQKRRKHFYLSVLLAIGNH